MRKIARNPYRFTNAVDPSDFLGRNEIVARMLSDLCSSTNDSYGIVGGKRFGKTSLLRALENQLISALQKTESLDYWAIPVYTPLKSMSPRIPEDVIGYLLHKLRLVTAGPKKPPPISKGPIIHLGLPIYEAISPLPASVQELEQAVETIVEKAYSSMGIVHVALLIDGMDNIIHYPWTADIFGMLRSIIYDGPMRDYVRFAIAGTGRYYWEAEERGSHLFESLRGEFLEVFDETSTLELINRVSGLSLPVTSEVLKQGGGHPFILQYILHYLFELSKADMATAILDNVDDAVQHFVHERSADLESWWGEIGDHGRYVYRILLEAENWMTGAQIVAGVNSPELEVDRGLKALVFQGIALHDGTFRKYRIGSKLFRDWANPRCQALPKRLSEGATTSMMNQTAGANSTQFAQLINSTVNINQNKSSSPSRFEIEPERADRLGRVVNMLKQYFSREDFRTLCFNLGIRYDQLVPGGLEVQAIQVVEAYDNAGQLEILTAAILRFRPGRI